MNTETVSGKFTASAVAVNVECGFIPDSIQLIQDLAGTPIHYKWDKVLYDHAALATGKWGWVVDVAPVRCNGATNGFIPYDTSVESVVLPAPDGDGYLKAASIADFDATEAAYVARSLTALGSVVRPTVHNGFVYEQITHIGAHVEPTWPTKIGEIVTNAAGDVWICREERVVRTGVKGFTVGTTISVAGQYWYFKAEKHSRHNYMGDARVENPVTFGGHMR